MPFYVDNHKVKIVTRRKSQTINVYVQNDVERVYNPKLRINQPEHFVNEKFFRQQAFPSIEAMVTFLRQECHADIEDEYNVAIDVTSRKVVISVDQAWASRAIPDIEQAINTLVDEFIRFSYLHRVEHSLHCELYRHLLTSPSLNESVKFGTFEIKAVQKEWPETIPRPGKNGRGKFDLAILGPPMNPTTLVNVLSFRLGYLEPAAVIEVGLDYGLPHLKSDVEKLKNSKIINGYIIHFARPYCESQLGVEDYVTAIMKKEASGGPRIVYANIGSNEIRYRRLGDKNISSICLRV